MKWQDVSFSPLPYGSHFPTQKDRHLYNTNVVVGVKSKPKPSFILEIRLSMFHTFVSTVFTLNILNIPLPIRKVLTCHQLLYQFWTYRRIKSFQLARCIISKHYLIAWQITANQIMPQSS